MPDVEVQRLPRRGGRPAGSRFGSLVHAVLALVPLQDEADAVAAVAGVQGRLLGAPVQEADAAAALVRDVLRHPVLQRASSAETRGRCRREVPVTLSAGAVLLEGTVDLLFEENGRWFLVDFKSDDPSDDLLDEYRRQVALYAVAAGRALGHDVGALILAL